MKTNSNIEIYSNKLTLSFLFLFVFILSCSDQNTTNFEVDSAVSIASYTATDVRYGPDSNQIFDIYLPENRTPNTKIVVLIHGGGMGRIQHKRHPVPKRSYNIILHLPMVSIGSIFLALGQLKFIA
jgi:hypothetical protein